MIDVTDAALPESGCPPPPGTLWLWTGQAMYLGPSLRLDPHSGSVGCLALGVDAPFRLSADGLGERTVCSALIPPRTVHRVVAGGRRMLFCYLDPGSARAAGCRDRMIRYEHGFGLGHTDEAALIELASEPAPDPRDLLDVVTGPLRPIDGRIADAVDRLRADPGGRLTASELAAEAHLSTSRFLHLFAAHAGTSFRRYRLWARMLHVGRAWAKGLDLTTAAVDAGFASPSHFSDAFHTMTGLTATALISSGTELVLLD